MKKIDPKDFTYGIMAIDTTVPLENDMVQVIHAVLFTDPPTFQDYMTVYDELEKDQELGMSKKDRYLDYVLVPASNEIVAEMKLELTKSKSDYQFKMME